MVLSVAELAVLYMVCLCVNVCWRHSLPGINLCAFAVIPYPHHQCAQSGFPPGGPRLKHVGVLMVTSLCREHKVLQQLLHCLGMSVTCSYTSHIAGKC